MRIADVIKKLHEKSGSQATKDTYADLDEAREIEDEDGDPPTSKGRDLTDTEITAHIAKKFKSAPNIARKIKNHD